MCIRDSLDTADKGTIQGLNVEQSAKKVVNKLYEDGLLVGQKTNRPAPPAPEKDAAGGFFQLFWAKGNNPSRIERLYADMWEHDVIKHYKGIFHVNPGGYTYSEGWSELMRGYAEIMDEDTRLREAADAAKAGKEVKVSDASQLGSENMLGGGGLLLMIAGTLVGFPALRSSLLSFRSKRRKLSDK